MAQEDRERGGKRRTVANPTIDFSPRDWVEGTAKRGLSLAEKGFLIDFVAVSVLLGDDGRLPANRKALARMLGLRMNNATALAARLVEKGELIELDDWIYSPRAQQETRKLAERFASRKRPQSDRKARLDDAQATPKRHHDDSQASSRRKRTIENTGEIDRRGRTPMTDQTIPESDSRLASHKASLESDSSGRAKTRPARPVGGGSDASRFHGDNGAPARKPRDTKRDQQIADRLAKLGQGLAEARSLRNAIEPSETGLGASKGDTDQGKTETPRPKTETRPANGASGDGEPDHLARLVRDGYGFPSGPANDDGKS